MRQRRRFQFFRRRLFRLSADASGSQGDASTGSGSTGGEAVDLSDVLVEPGKLIMSTNAAFPPYEMVADGEGVYQGYEGIDVEIAVALADKLGLELADRRHGL